MSLRFVDLGLMVTLTLNSINKLGVLFALALGVTGCGLSGFNSSSNSSSSGNQLCVAPSAVTSLSSSDPFAQFRVSVDVDSSWPTALDRGPANFGMTGPDDMLSVGSLGLGFRQLRKELSRNRGTLKSGREIAIVVDRVCALDHKQEKGRLLRRILKENKLNTGLNLSRLATLSVKLAAQWNTDELESWVKSEPCLVGISNSVKMGLLSADRPNDPFVSRQRQLTAVQAAEGWLKFYGATNGIAKEIVIAVIDGGIQVDHPDLQGQIYVNRREIPGNGIDDDNNGYVDDVSGWNFANQTPWVQTGNPSSDYHATHVSGLAAGQADNGLGIAGIMGSNAKIMPLNVFGTNSTAVTSSIDAAIRYAADNGAHIINLSLGGPGRSDSTGSAMAYATSRGVTILIAAGNTTTDISQTFFTPASMRNT